MPRTSCRDRRCRTLEVVGSLLAVAVIVVTSLGALATVVVLSAPAPPRRTAVAHPYPGGGVVPFGDASTYGALDTTLSSVITGMAATPDGQGYWLVGADGGLFAFGDAAFYGSLGAVKLTGPIVAMAATPDGKGYWLAGLDGGVFAFGDAVFDGSMGGTRLTQPIVGMAATPDGQGYWLVAGDGGVFSFGDAAFYGSMGATHLVAGVTGMAATTDGKGYWMVAGDGGVFAFGDAAFYGSLGNRKSLPASVAGMAATTDGDGYWMVGNDGSVYPFGDAQGFGSTATTKPMSPVSAMVPTHDGQGYWLLEPDDWSYSFTGTSPVRARGLGRHHRPGDQPGRARPRHRLGPVLQPLRAVRAVVRALPHLGVGARRSPHRVHPLHRQHLRLGRRPRPHRPARVLPAPGDAVLYGTGPQSTATSVHTGLVVQVWPDSAVVTVEGDAGPAPSGQLAVIINGPFLPADSSFNGVGVYAVAQGRSAGLIGRGEGPSTRSTGCRSEAGGRT